MDPVAKIIARLICRHLWSCLISISTSITTGGCMEETAPCQFTGSSQISPLLQNNVGYMIMWECALIRPGSGGNCKAWVGLERGHLCPGSDSAEGGGEVTRKGRFGLHWLYQLRNMYTCYNCNGITLRAIGQFITDYSSITPIGVHFKILHEILTSPQWSILECDFLRFSISVFRTLTPRHMCDSAIVVRPTSWSETKKGIGIVVWVLPLRIPISDLWEPHFWCLCMACGKLRTASPFLAFRIFSERAIDRSRSF